MADMFSYLLTRHPHIFAKVRREIHTTIGDNPNIKREDLVKMRYLSNVFRESTIAHLALILT